MADTRISKIQVRQGDIADLPILGSGEFGYALDEQRLFIGNRIMDVGVGNAAQVVFPIAAGANYASVNNVLNPIFFFDGTQVNGTAYTVNGSFVTFATPPASGVVITMQHNSEVAINGAGVTPGSFVLDASAPAGTTAAFGFDTRVFDTAFIDYSIKLSGGTGFRIGQLRIVVDEVNGTYYIDDQHNYLTTQMGITFDGDITNNTFTLTYENIETLTATFYYTFKLWKM